MYVLRSYLFWINYRIHFDLWIVFSWQQFKSLDRLYTQSLKSAINNFHRERQRTTKANKSARLDILERLKWNSLLWLLRNNFPKSQVLVNDCHLDVLLRNGLNRAYCSVSARLKCQFLMFISILVFRPEGQIWNPVRRDTRIYVRRILNASRFSKTQLNSCTISPS